jgi:RND family efflux transporter MFP subunit
MEQQGRKFYNMKKFQPAIILIIVALVMVACGRQETGTPADEALVTVQRQTLSVTVSGSGTIQPRRIADLTFGSAGTVEEVLVEEGQQVEEGQALARLDSRDADANVAIAQAQLDQAQAQLEQLQQGASTEESDVSAAQAAWEARQGGQQQEPTLDSNVSAAEAAVQQAEAQLMLAELNRDRTTLRAPFAGTIVASTVNVGDSVPMTGVPGALFQLADLSALYIDATVSEADVARIKEGQTARIVIDAIGNKDINGTITYVAPVATVAQNVATYRVRADFPQDIANVRAGMSASVEIDVAERPDVLIVPNSAIRSEGGRQFVRLQRNDQFVDTEVETGLSNDFQTEITSGLNEGDVIAAIGIVTEAEQSS